MKLIRAYLACQKNNARTGQRLRLAVLPAFFLIATVSCTNSNLSNLKLAALSHLATPSPTASSTGSIAIINVTIPAPASPTDRPTATINLNATQTQATPLNTFCSLVTTASVGPCVCQFSWNELNQNTGTSVIIPHTAQTALTTVQPSTAACLVPPNYASEILAGTQVTLSILSSPGTGSFASGGYVYTVSNGSTPGSFQDAQGNSFDNILHYTCYEQYSKGLNIVNALGAAISDPSNTNPAITPVIASQLCVAPTNGSNTITTSSNCASPLITDNSAQANYYDLYVRNSEQGDINQGNGSFVCPLVKEVLYNPTGQSQYWPLDTNFALSLGMTPTFNIGVEAFTAVSLSSGSKSQNSSCFSSASPSPTPSSSAAPSSSANSSGSFVQSCLGFAAAPASDGTCPSFKNASGAMVLTYRLRRYITLYPPVFDVDGWPYPHGSSAHSQLANTIYVLDRPVTSPLADPMKPFTLRGPKPCPFAYYDSKGALGVSGVSGANTFTALASSVDAGYAGGFKPGYAGTNNTAWNWKNVDGTELPNKDINSATPAQKSCSAPVALLDPTNTYMTLGTVNQHNPALNHVYIRPFTAWAPHWEEDTNFKACAPQANPVKDPPLHFSKDSSSNVSWCAEVYPTQNDNVAVLDRTNGGAILGRVAPFTSHVSKNTTAAACSFTTLTNIPVGYPAGIAGYGNHNVGNAWDTGNMSQTCDRTVVNTSALWAKFPLLAPAGDVEAALANDSTYNCSVSYDGGLGKVLSGQTPTQGCCGTVVNVWTGAPAAPHNATAAHLEPTVSCATPLY